MENPYPNFFSVSKSNEQDTAEKQLQEISAPAGKKKKKKKPKKPLSSPIPVLDDNEIIEKCSTVQQAQELLCSKNVLVNLQYPLFFFFKLWRKFPELLADIFCHEQYVAAITNYSNITVIREMFSGNLKEISLTNFWVVALKQQNKKNKKDFQEKLKIFLELLLAHEKGIDVLTKIASSLLQNTELSLSQKAFFISATMKSFTEEGSLYKNCGFNLKYLKKIAEEITIQKAVSSLAVPIDYLQLLTYINLKIQYKNFEKYDFLAPDLWKEFFLDKFNHNLTEDSLESLLKEKDGQDYQMLFLERIQLDHKFLKFLILNQNKTKEKYEELLSELVKKTDYFYNQHNDFSAGLLFVNLMFLQGPSSHDYEGIVILNRLKENHYQEHSCVRLLAALETRFYTMSIALDYSELLKNKTLSFKDKELLAFKIVKILERLYKEGNMDAGLLLGKLSVSYYVADNVKLGYLVDFDDAKKILSKLMRQNFKVARCKEILGEIAEQEREFITENTKDLKLSEEDNNSFIRMNP